MKQKAVSSIVAEIMTEFADATDLASAGKGPRRYLWTDAFAVCNFLELYRQTSDAKYKSHALLLVDQVHTVLGRHREDDSRTGWISGLEEQEGRIHPTIGGLRIGKKMNERAPHDPFDDRLEWDRDGQYYHYLTKWMHALNRVSRVIGDATFNAWAIELAKTAHAKFTYVPFPGGQKSMYWKMSIDLCRPLIPSMGQHDPLDGFITYHQLQAAAAEDAQEPQSPDLSEEIAEMADICTGRNWVTDDSLGIGGLLSDAYKVAQMMVSYTFAQTDLLETLLDASIPGLKSYARANSLNLPARYRLAFRELGLSIGLRAVARLQGVVEKNSGIFSKKQQLGAQLEVLMRYVPLTEIIENFWLEGSNRETSSWTEHGDINRVMLATSLAPDGYLTL